MRQTLNENPVAQVVVIALLAIGIAFLFMTRIMKGDEAVPVEPASTTPTAPAVGEAPSAAAPAAGTPATPATGAPSVTDAAAAPAGAPSAGGFVAGPGLPAEVVQAYEDGKPVVVLITRQAGTEDKRLRAMINQARGVGGSAVFTTNARHIARYSRIARGVDVSRVPALVVVRPQKLSEGALPEATVSYGFRGPQSVEQAVRDALYKGRDDIPYYPE